MNSSLVTSSLILLPVFFVRYIMERIDMVLVGAEKVVESGGLINKVFP